MTDLFSIVDAYCSKMTTGLHNMIGVSSFNKDEES